MQPAGGKCSIMLRSLKSTSKCTQESADAAFQREEELLAARRARLQQAEQRLACWQYPTDAVVRRRRQEVSELQQQHAADKAAARRREADAAQPCAAWASKAPVPGVRPWAGSTLNAEQEQLQARRVFAAELAEANAALAAARANAAAQQREADARADRQLVTNEAYFWTLGAAGPRWIAPEHRHLAPASASSSGSGGGSCAAPARKQAPAMQHPWAWPGA